MLAHPGVFEKRPAVPQAKSPARRPAPREPATAKARNPRAQQSKARALTIRRSLNPARLSLVLTADNANRASSTEIVRLRARQAAEKRAQVPSWKQGTQALWEQRDLLEAQSRARAEEVAEKLGAPGRESAPPEDCGPDEDEAAEGGDTAEKRNTAPAAGPSKWRGGATALTAQRRAETAAAAAEEDARLRAEEAEARRIGQERLRKAEEEANHVRERSVEWQSNDHKRHSTTAGPPRVPNVPTLQERSAMSKLSQAKCAARVTPPHAATCSPSALQQAKKAPMPAAYARGLSADPPSSSSGPQESNPLRRSSGSCTEFDDVSEAPQVADVLPLPQSDAPRQQQQQRAPKAPQAAQAPQQPSAAAGKPTEGARTGDRFEQAAPMMTRKSLLAARTSLIVQKRLSVVVFQPQNPKPLAPRSALGQQQSAAATAPSPPEQPDRQENARQSVQVRPEKRSSLRRMSDALFSWIRRRKTQGEPSRNSMSHSNRHHSNSRGAHAHAQAEGAVANPKAQKKESFLAKLLRELSWIRRAKEKKLQESSEAPRAQVVVVSQPRTSHVPPSKALPPPPACRPASAACTAQQCPALVAENTVDRSKYDEYNIDAALAYLITGDASALPCEAQGAQGPDRL
eukprot:m51a1_g2080 hypothetical protein (630) ;mRNA; r:1501488-1503561